MTAREGTLAGQPAPEVLPPGPQRLPSARRKLLAASERSDDPEALLSDAKDAMGHELQRLRREAGIRPLKPDEIRSLALLADAACKLAREEREAAKADDVAGLPKEELIRRAEAALAVLREGT